MICCEQVNPQAKHVVLKDAPSLARVKQSSRLCQLAFRVLFFGRGDRPQRTVKWMFGERVVRGKMRIDAASSKRM